MSVGHVDRRISASVASALEWSPVVAITGARTAGRSTLARGLTELHGGSFVDLDAPEVRALTLQ
ncbi:MAG: hypothetical protein L0H64_02130 [Pseudonocardia sp.]|nr:hypothetical protein [Pseudonocardia sp.]